MLRFHGKETTRLFITHKLMSDRLKSDAICFRNPEHPENQIPEPAEIKNWNDTSRTKRR